MNTRRLFSILALSLGCSLALSAADTPAKNGYKVVLDMKITEAGVVDDASIVESDDKSVDHVLEVMAMESAKVMKLPPRLKEGKPVAYTARAPFLFSVEGDEGPEANNAPKPSLRGAQQQLPIYPPELAEKGEVGGVILQLVIAADGKLSSVKALRSSHPLFEQAALTAVKQWTFSPAKKGDVPVESRWNVSVSFETEALRAEWKWRFPPRPSLGSFAVVRRSPPIEPVSAPTTPQAK